MNSIIFLGCFLTLVLFPIFGAGDGCSNPAVTHEVYTTHETTISAETVIIVEFTVDCRNGAKDMILYAELNGKTLPASIQIAGTEQGTKYQVSWSDEHKKIPAGTYKMSVFDEEGYSELRKAQRSGEDGGKIKSLFSIDVTHRGTSRGFYLQSEFVAAWVAIIVWYSAYTARTKLQA